jgi:hypothetical protein
MFVVRPHPLAGGFFMAAAFAAACARAEEEFTPVAAGVRYRKIGVWRPRR